MDVTYIEYLRGLLFSFTDIAKIMGISRATLYRRLDDAGVSRVCTYSTITDAALDLVWFQTLLRTKYAHALITHALAEKKGLVQNYTLTRAKAGM